MDNFSVHSVTYFACKHKHGLFVTPHKISMLRDAIAPKSAPHLPQPPKAQPSSSNLLKTPAEIASFSPLVRGTPMDVDATATAAAGMRASAIGSAQSALRQSFGRATPAHPTNGVNFGGGSSGVKTATKRASLAGGMRSSLRQTTPSLNADSLAYELRQKDVEINFLKAQISAYFVQMNEQRITHEEYVQRKEADVSRMLTEIAAAFTAHETLLGNYEATRRDFPVQLQSLQDKLDALTSENARLTSAAESVEVLLEKLTVKEGEVRRLQDDLENTRRQLYAAKSCEMSAASATAAINSRHENELCEAQAERMRLLEDNASLGDRVTALQSQNDSLMAECVALKHQLSQHLSVINDYEAKNMQLNTQLIDTAALQAQFDAANSTLQTQMTAVNDSISMRDAEIHQLKTEAACKNDELANLTMQLQKFQSSTSIFTDSNEAKMALDARDQQIIDLTKKIEFMQQEMHSKTAAFNAQLAALQAENTTLRFEVHSLKSTAQSPLPLVSATPPDRALEPFESDLLAAIDGYAADTSGSFSPASSGTDAEDRVEGTLELLRRSIESVAAESAELRQIDELLGSVQLDQRAARQHVEKLVNRHQLNAGEDSHMAQFLLRHDSRTTPLSPNTAEFASAGGGGESLRQMTEVLHAMQDNAEVEEAILGSLTDALRHDFCTLCAAPGHTAASCMTAAQSHGHDARTSPTSVRSS